MLLKYRSFGVGLAFSLAVAIFPGFLTSVRAQAPSPNLGRSPTDEPSPKSEQTASDPFIRINKDFVDRYNLLLMETKAKAKGPVVLQCGSSLVLLRNGTETKTRVLDHRYRVFEAMSHIPVSIYVTLHPFADRKLAGSELEELKGVRTLIENANSFELSSELNPRQLGRANRLMQQSMAFIDKVLANGEVSAVSLHDFERAQTKDIEENLRDAADDQIAAMDRQLTSWLATMSPEERAHLSVVVCGPHMAREANISMQFMAAKLERRFSGRCQQEETTQTNPQDWRLIYAETFKADEALTLLAEHRLDSELGKVVFDEPLRMHRDVLGDSATGLIVKDLPGTKIVEPSEKCESGPRQ